MNGRLEDLARKLRENRSKGNKKSLDWILESARILRQARELAGRGFGKWLREQGHMDPLTARRHLRVAEFVENNRSLTNEIAKLSIAKVYALCTLDLGRARRIASGQERFSAPLEHLPDVRFRQEFRQRFPFHRKRRNRQHVFQEVRGALARLRKALTRGHRFAARMTADQIRKIKNEFDEVVRTAERWKGVA